MSLYGHTSRQHSSSTLKSTFVLYADERIGAINANMSGFFYGRAETVFLFTANEAAMKRHVTRP